MSSGFQLAEHARWNHDKVLRTQVRVLVRKQPGSSPNLAVTAFVFPDDQNPGNIETLCLAAARQEPSLAVALTCVDAFFDCLQRGQVSLPQQPALAKNHAQTYLATRMAAQLFPGTAAYRQHWPWDVAAMEPLKRFLLKL
jgi:hypothetical protein